MSGANGPNDAEGIPFRVLLRMEIHPGMEHEFEQTWHRVGSAIVTHPANLGHWLSRGAEDKSVYYVVSDWVDEARFREFEKSEAHVKHREQLHPYRSKGSMTTMRVIYGMTGAASR
ncbi:antibiotic biosynthesis monooxygenase family protein [Asanoa iriomotensis]|uniref:Antibiotic biosynthesis monooxygenase n=1 Tax=Asanoa iriomotensis TaxID=234613 RepID=A0ABQ4C0Y3_9ACTN|nr:antibiotic biosynthesis monooxygenase family protein [Asanoa iriomotensis]GIF56432.1 antibiotic biosynthesis monooxygenase [Asanoa iriomotensis]